MVSFGEGAGGSHWERLGGASGYTVSILVLELDSGEWSSLYENSLSWPFRLCTIV